MENKLLNNTMTPEIFKPLIALFNQMDETWNKVAAQYSFQCNGCKDNCCKSLFFHHTYIEKAYLLHGFNLLDQNQKELISLKAHEYCNKTFKKNQKITSQKIFCPANEKGQCLIYQFRPMICRFHGLPYELNRPGSTTLKGAGCDAGQFYEKQYIKFDRTPFYTSMAKIELNFRENINKADKIKESIAQMLISQQTSF